MGNSRKIIQRLALSATIAALGVSALTGAAPDPATTPAAGDWSIRNDTTGETIAVSELPDLIAPPAPEGTVQPNLIDDPLAWGACFGPLFNADWPLDEYHDVPLATGTVYLQCGPNDTNSYGWHHIQANHQDQWQARIDAAVAAGGGPGAAWDDFMAYATNAAVTGPGGWTKEYDGKRCYTTPITIIDSNNNDLFTFNPTVIVSMSNNRIITSYPTTSQDCTRQAAWDWS